MCSTVVLVNTTSTCTISVHSTLNSPTAALSVSVRLSGANIILTLQQHLYVDGLFIEAIHRLR